MLGEEGFLHLFAAKRRDAPGQLFARFNGEPITFEMLGRMADSLAATLRERGLARGDRVTVMLRNSPATLATIFGLARAGIVWVPVNVRYRGPGLKYILEHCDPRLVIAEEDLVATIRGSDADLRDAPLVLHGGADVADSLDRMLMKGAHFEEPPPQAADHFAICYTSGTTGNPKGVILTHAMLRFAGEAAALVSDAREGDVLLMWEPLYHIGGMQLIILPLIRGTTLAMIDRFSASRILQQTREYGASHIHFLGGVLQILLKQPPSELDRSHGARIAWGGGCPKDIWRPFEQRFGVQIRECYGMTEASSFTTYNDNGTVGAVGHPMPWFSVELRDEHDRPVPAGERGEIVVRSRLPNAIFPGYFRNPEATARVLRNGALYSGDLGRFDEHGNLFFLGRMTDSVRCKGENVSAWEVERVAAAYPTIEDCAMIGVAAEVGEQDIKLFVKPKANTTIDPATLSAWLAERLAPFQNPRYIVVIEEFERTPSERIMKHKLSRQTVGCWDRLARREPEGRSS
ncbi:MAG TPA: AMP-binding protein [Stellaceae bacterium]|nr:AMP-binding protein [Stellaceae bacterium]